jgi:membrane-bound lytic murein transglycosylase B
MRGADTSGVRPPSTERPRLTARTRPAVLAVVCALAFGLLQAGQGDARAETADQAKAAAKAAQQEVERLVPQVRAALTDYQQALVRLGRDVNTGVSADEAAQQAQDQVEQLQLDQAQRVRALYMAGGQAGLLTTVLDSQGPADFTERISMLDRVMSASTTQLQWATEAASAARQDADEGLAQADATGETAGDVQQRYEHLVALLGAAQARLDQLSQRAKTLAAAEAAARELAALAAAAASAGTQAAGSARGHGIPPAYLALYRAAATTCPGMDWHVLAAIGQVESGHGHNVGPSSAGAEGPMQFMPATFAGYAVDGNGDGVTDIWNPADAIYTAARYLCANGAGSPTKLYTAIWHYNHADWYVQMVLGVAADLRRKYPI